MGVKRLFALRGATLCLNSEEDMRNKVVDMYDALLSENNLEEEEIVSVFFSVTGDLDAINPATALRREGRAEKIALLVSQEARFAGSPEQVIRLLIHCYMEASRIPVHVYRNGAEALRPDFTADSCRELFDN